MTYTILSASYANAAHTAAVIMTQEAAAVVISSRDTPAEWAAMLAWGTPSAYVTPPTPVPSVISDRQFFQQLAIAGTITQAEALSAVKTGAIPAALSGFLSSLPADGQFAAEMLLSGATEFRRDHPLTAAVGAAQGMTSAQIDAFWIAASTL